ncbi:ACD11 homolog protein isoform X2 [Humulus lupulus]|uniref:ACD11 homolog protein isoform X2 n=1 Tax=Humulus lupulus TaxID=3486 RepID=UPI002B40452F|nr:ACD11 homolog protein isoform X2 [Humulus lupulus]
MILNARESCAAMDGGVPERFINASTAASSYPLSAIADAFEELSKLINSGKLNESQPYQLRLDTFCEACSLISFLFGCLGLAFKFAECEYVSKVHNLVEASKRYGSLQNMIDSDVANGTVKTSGSNSRNLRRVSDYYLKGAASTAYAEVCAPYHSWAIRAAVAAGMYALPTREQLLLKLNETNQSAEKKMRRYITASIPVIEYIDKLYLSRNIKLDW